MSNSPELATEEKMDVLRERIIAVTKSLASERNSGEVDGDVDDEVDPGLFDEAMSALANENSYWRWQLKTFPRDAVHHVWSLLSTEFKLAQTKLSEMSLLLDATAKRRADL